jgi:hypothetical protein
MTKGAPSGITTTAGYAVLGPERMLTFAVAKPRVAASASAGMATSARSAIAPYNFFFTFVLSLDKARLPISGILLNHRWNAIWIF